MRRVFRGNKRIAKKIFKKYAGLKGSLTNEINFMRFAASIKPGDIIGTAHGYNDVVTRIEYTYKFARRNTGKASSLIGMVFYTENNMIIYHDLYHSDLYPAFSKKDIEEYFLKWSDDESLQFAQSWNMQEVFNSAVKIRDGYEICDDNGLRLCR
jgi:hypothetical protein